jgi:hypothetical protein
MSKLIKLILALSALSFLTVPGAQAGLLLFTLTDAYDATFTLSSNPTPSGFFQSNNPYFDDVGGTLDGSPIVYPVVIFYSSSNSGGVSASTSLSSSENYFNLYGATIFSGTATNPIFAPGVFVLTNLSGGPTQAILTISEVPEPSTWALMIAGFAGLGFVGYRTQRKNRALRA